MHEDGFLSRSNDPKIHWVHATLLIAAVFCIGFAGCGLAGLGPCGPGSPWVLGVSAGLSAAAIYASAIVLTSKQRQLRLLTIPFYLTLLIAIAFVGLQALIFMSSIAH
jgi:hypothetical protein